LPGLRIDKYLHFARFLKTRSMAAALVEAGEVRINDQPARKASQLVKPGDQLVFPMGKRRRRVLVLALGARRGAAPEAQALYQELEPPPPEDPWGEDGV
jgi:ribosome-associated heat shock protein Hsp15